MMIYAIALCIGYFMGSVPFGLVLTRLAGTQDLRSVGSGNIGATNVLRTGRKDLALATVILDSIKAGLAFFILWTVSGDRSVALLAGASAFIGHCYPVWLGFKGGKGVATYAGFLLFSFWWQIFTVGAASWLGVLALTRISSVSALVTALIVPLAAIITGASHFEISILSVLSILVFWTHRANLKRIMRGEEPKIGKQKAHARDPIQP